jgi:hypothetical protein
MNGTLGSGRCLVIPSLSEAALTRSASQDVAPLQQPNYDNNQDDDQQQVDQAASKRRDERAKQPQDKDDDDDRLKRISRHR